MQRSIIVHTGEKIIKKDNWFLLLRDDGEHRIPIEDIYCVVIDNPHILLSGSVLTGMTCAGAHVLLCNEKHLPVTIILPQANYYRPLDILRKQISMEDVFKDKLWSSIIRAKLINQADVLELAHGNGAQSTRIKELAKEVEDGDSGNREGIGAKIFFRAMYGTEFIRMGEDGINAALNYGYTILRSSVAKALCVHGYNTILGIHHINEMNYFNLADDLMEPWRPIVDMWVDAHHEELMEELTKDQRRDLIGLVNRTVIFQGKKMKLRNALDRYVMSLTSALEKEDVSLLSFPTFFQEDDR